MIPIKLRRNYEERSRVSQYVAGGRVIGIFSGTEGESRAVKEVWLERVPRLTETNGDTTYRTYIRFEDDSNNYNQISNQISNQNSDERLVDLDGLGGRIDELTSKGSTRIRIIRFGEGSYFVSRRDKPGQQKIMGEEAA